MQRSALKLLQGFREQTGVLEAKAIRGLGILTSREVHRSGPSCESRAGDPLGEDDQMPWRLPGADGRSAA